MKRKTLVSLGELTCTRCKCAKHYEEFAISNITKTGRKTRCKACERHIELARRELKKDQIKLQDKERSQDPGRKAYMSAKRAEWQKRNPEKVSASRKLQRAVKKGLVIKHACMVCGEPEVEGHHPDYSRPLDVVWLCIPHHQQVHKEHNSW